MRFSGTFKASQRAPNPPTACPLSVPEDRTACRFGVREAHTGKKLFHASSEPGGRRAADAQGTASIPAMRAGVRCGSPAPLKHFSAPGIHQKHTRLVCRRTAPYARSASGKPMSPKKLFHASSEPGGRRAADAQGTASIPAMRAGVRCGSPAPLKQSKALGIHQQHARLACRRTAPYARSASGKPISPKKFHASREGLRRSVSPLGPQASPRLVPASAA